MREQTVAIKSTDGAPEAALLLTFEFRREGDQWLAECLELGTATFAETLDAVREEIAEATALQLNQVQEMGFAEGFLGEHGIRLIPIVPPATRPPKPASWDIPIPAGF